MSLFSGFDFYFFSVGFFVCMFFCGGFFYSSHIFCASKALMSHFSAKSSTVFMSNSMGSPKLFQVTAVSVFFYTLNMNLGSMPSFTYCPLSQVSVVVSIGLSIFLCVLVMSMSNFPTSYVYHMIPEGSPMVLSWVVFMIELVSVAIRPITISVRLIANSMAGHVLLSLLAYLVLSHPVFTPMYVALCMAEIAVCFVQSYIFVTMACIYFNDVGYW